MGNKICKSISISPLSMFFAVCLMVRSSVVWDKMLVCKVFSKPTNCGSDRSIMSEESEFKSRMGFYLHEDVFLLPSWQERSSVVSVLSSGWLISLKHDSVLRG